MDEQRAMRLCRDLMNDSVAVYLSTLGPNGYPNIRAMLNLRNTRSYPGLAPFFAARPLDFALYFTTNTSSAKVGQLLEDPRAAAYYCDPENWRGAMICGDLELAGNMDIKEALWQSEWTMYYPGGPADPDYAVLRLTPVFVRGYHQMENYEFVPEGRGQ